MKTSSFLSLIAGALIGGAIACLYSPRNGRENREMLKDYFDKELKHMKGKCGCGCSDNYDYDELSDEL